MSTSDNCECGGVGCAGCDWEPKWLRDLADNNRPPYGAADRNVGRLIAEVYSLMAREARTRELAAAVRDDYRHVGTAGPEAWDEFRETLAALLEHIEGEP